MAKNKVEISVAGTQMKIGASTDAKISAEVVASKVDATLVSRLKHAVELSYGATTIILPAQGKVDVEKALLPNDLPVGLGLINKQVGG